jgi:hypothetical protein
MEGKSRPVASSGAGLILVLFLVVLLTACGGSIAHGTQFGFVHEVGGGTLIFDPAQWLSGDAATAAYRAHGEDPVEPFYIDNAKIEKMRLKVDDAARFSLLAYDSTGTPSLEKSLSYTEFAHVCAAADDEQLPSAGFGTHEAGLPMYLTISHGRVTGGKEQYVP